MSLRLRSRRGSLDRSSARPAAATAPSDSSAVYEDLLRCAPRDREEAVRYLVRRGLPEDEARRLRPAFIGDYRALSQRLLARHGARRLARAGVLSPRGHLIYYRHRVILPVREHGRLVAVAGRAFDAAAVPATLLPHGVILSEAARHALAQLLQRLREPTPLSAQLPLVPG
jgi:hypothetical protein